jgi:hypothetical protein
MSRRRCQSRGVSFLSMMVRPRESVMRYRPGSILSRFPSWYRTSIARPLTSIEAPAGRAERDGPGVWPFRPEASPARPPLPPPPPFPCARAVPATGSVAAGKPVAPVRRRKNVRRVTMIGPRGRAAWFGRALARPSRQPFFIPGAMNPRSGRPDGIQQQPPLINVFYPDFAPCLVGTGRRSLPVRPGDVFRRSRKTPPIAPPSSPGRPHVPIRVLHSASACTIALPDGRQRRPFHHRGSRRRS